MCRAIISSSLVGITHAETRAPGVLMRGPPAAFAAGVKLDAEPCRVAANAFADGGRVLADAAGEHDRIQPAKRGGERTELAPNAIAKQIDRELRPRIARGESSVRMSLELPDTPSSPD